MVYFQIEKDNVWQELYKRDVGQINISIPILMPHWWTNEESSFFESL